MKQSTVKVFRLVYDSADAAGEVPARRRPGLTGLSGTWLGEDVPAATSFKLKHLPACSNC
jgi:hypothetical protein